MKENHQKWSEIYEYYQSRGLSNYVMKNTTMIIIGVAIALSPIIIFGCIDYKGLPSAANLSDILYSFPKGWARTNTFFKVSTVVFLLYIFVIFLQFLISIPRFVKLHKYYESVLGISDRSIYSTKWNEIVESVSVSDALQPVSMLTIAQEILRSDNYICSLVSDPSILTWKLPKMAKLEHIPMSQFFFKFFKLALKGVVIDQNGNSLVNGGQTAPRQPRIQSKLSLRFRLIGIALFFAIPLMLPFELLYIIFNFSKTIRSISENNSFLKSSGALQNSSNQPSSLSFREWTPEAKWAIREYNELPHLFKIRIAKSYEFANSYLDQFPVVFVQPIAKIISFASGSILIILGLIALMTDINLILTTKVLCGKSVAWFAILLLFIYVICSKIGNKQPPTLAADESMAELEKYIHYDFRDETNSVHSINTQKRLSHFFQPIWKQIILEIFSVFLNPFLFAIVLPVKSGSIVEFIKTNSVENPELGWICAFATFDMNERGFNGQANQRDKVLRSMKNFETNNDEPTQSFMTQDFTNSEMTDSIVHEGTLMPRASSPLVRTDFGGSNEALNNIDNYSPTEFFAYPAELDQDI